MKLSSVLASALLEDLTATAEKRKGVVSKADSNGFRDYSQSEQSEGNVPSNACAKIFVEILVARIATDGAAKTF